MVGKTFSEHILERNVYITNYRSTIHDLSNEFLFQICKILCKMSKALSMFLSEIQSHKNFFYDVHALVGKCW